MDDVKFKRQCVTVRACNSYALKDEKNPWCMFSIWPLSPALNTSTFWYEQSKRDKRNRFDPFFIAFRNLKRICKFPYKSAVHLPENHISLTAGFLTTLARHHVCPLLPLSLPPLFSAQSCIVQFSCQPSSAAFLQASFFVQTYLPDVCGVRTVTMTRPQRMLLWAALVTLRFHLLCCQIVFTRDGPCPSNVLSL